MSNYFATAFASSILFSLAVSPVSAEAVAIKGSIQPETAHADHFTVTVQLDIGEGWHIYDEVGENGSEMPTSLKLKLPAGATTQGDWSRPRSKAGTEAHNQIFEGQVRFSRTVVIKPDAHGETIEVVISFQACTEKLCSPPQNKTVSITIPKAIPTSSRIFERPVRLSVDGKPLNTVAKKRFPSPAIFDVDGDGNTELVIGSLMGSIGVYENQNTSGNGDPVWGPSKSLKGSDGKAIRTPNW